MADSDNSSPEFNPQHRIVGAIILVILAIIVFPMILSEEELSTQDTGNEITISEKDAKIYVSKAKDIRNAREIKTEHETGSITGSSDTNKNKEKIREKVTTPELPKNLVAEKKTGVTIKKPVSVDDKKKKTEKDSKPAQKITKGWVVQIGTYSDPANAKKVRTTLVRHGYHVRMEKVRLSKGSATRVRVGPFSDRGKAITTLSHIGRDAGLQGVVLRYP